jgi:hypothetical protein
MTPWWRALRRRRRDGMPLAVEIAILLAVKLALLFAMGRLFFAEPQAPHMRMDPAQVSQRLLK